MPKPFDATLKDLVRSFLPDYEAQLGLGAFAPLVPLNVDLSTVTAATDVALGRGDPPDRIVDLNFQSGPDEDLESRALLYNALLHYRYHVPVHTLIVLLRPITGHARLTGRLRYEGQRRRGKMDFTYEVVRLWRQPMRRFLTGGLGTLPLAPLCRLPAGVPAAEALVPVIRRIDERLTEEASPADRSLLLTAAFTLTGLRVSRPVIEQLFRGVHGMKESSAYQIILEEGRIEALQKTLLRLGRRKFGAPGKAVQGAIRAITDEARLERLTERLLDVGSWQDLLATP